MSDRLFTKSTMLCMLFAFCMMLVVLTVDNKVLLFLHIKAERNITKYQI